MKKILVAFLEKDNVKLLSYEIKGKAAVRQFAGQISFSQDVLHDSFIADPVKFSNQIKIALVQKPEIATITEVVLFMPPDKTFTKALPASDSVDSFIRTLPYFKEELIINSPVTSPKQSAGGLTTHTAFERKLVEDFQRPFLESGKKIASIESSVNVLAKKQVGTGKYFLFIPFDKDTALAVCDNGEVLDIASFPKDAFPSRLVEHIAGKNLKDINTAYTVGVFSPDVIDKVKANASLTVNQLTPRDIYDLIVEAHAVNVKSNSISIKLPNQKVLFLIGAIIIGFIIVVLVAKGIASSQKPAEKPAPVVSTVPTPIPTPEPKAADFKITVLNGTLVTGEAGKLGDKLKALGFEITQTKNATSSAFTDTKLIVGDKTPAKITDTIKSSLLETYDNVVTEPTSTSSSILTVIIGKKK